MTLWSAGATTEQSETRERLRAVKTAIAASFLVCFVEIGMGWWLHLESLLAEGVHTLLDGFDSIVVLIAVLIAAKPADRSHPYGHGKFEALGASFEAFFILLAAIGIAYRAADHLIRNISPPAIPFYVCIAMGCASVFYFFVSAYLMRIARKSKSPAILAEAVHLRTHIYITGGIALGLLVGRFGSWPIVDNLLAMAVAICLTGMGLHVFREILRQFTDASLPHSELEELAVVIQSHSAEFVEVHGLRTRQAGAQRHIEMHLVVMPETSVAESHALSDRIEAAVRKLWPSSRTTIHVEPLNTQHADHRKWLQDQPKVRLTDSSPDAREFIH